MKVNYTLIFTVIIALNQPVFAQNLDEGLNYYSNGDYESAISFFGRFNTPHANLYSGKSYYSMGKILQARYYLNLASEASADADTKSEALYTLALTDFQIKDFTASLAKLEKLKQSGTNTALQTKADEFYNQILMYLSLKQVFTVFNRTTSMELRFNLLESSIGRFSYNDVSAILTKFRNSLIEYDRLRYNRAVESVGTAESYLRQYPAPSSSKAPFGTYYKIGVALPDFGFDSEDYEISQHIYFGIQLAIEDYNSTHSRKKVFLKYADTVNAAASPEKAFNELVWQEDVDAIIGPLFSDEAQKFSNLSEEYEVPVITPMATSMQLSGESYYLYQLNPTFAVHGKRMAEYAVKTLRLDTLAVIAEKDTPGAIAAYAFQNEVQKLGGVIKYMFVEDIESQGYAIAEYTAKFSKADTNNVAEGLKGIYAPFTGAAAASLIQSLITDLEATDSDYVLLGSEDWKSADFENRKFSNSKIYYSQSFDTDNSATREGSLFHENFVQLFQTEPNRFAYIGYDTAAILLKVLDEVQNPDYLNQGLKNLRNFRGLSTRVSFSGYHVNQDVEIKQIQNNR